MILILTGPRDEHADHVEQRLRERGIACVRFDPADFPATASISLAYAPNGRGRYLLRIGDRDIDLDGVTAVWLRRPGMPRAHAELEGTAHHPAVQAECRSLMDDVWQSIDARWIPARPETVVQAQRKAGQLRLAGELGFELPPTLITTDPDDLLAFYREHDGAIISKLLSSAFFPLMGTRVGRYTEPVSHRDIIHAESARLCPAIFQAAVPKRVELRITVVGTRVFAAEIHSQSTNHTRHDWRRYDHYATPYLPHKLPPETAARCVRLVERLGLCYGAIDMIVTPDGRYVFLEINSSGQYLWIEQMTGLPITDALCDLLIDRPAAGAPAA